MITSISSDNKFLPSLKIFIIDHMQRRLVYNVLRLTYVLILVILINLLASCGIPLLTSAIPTEPRLFLFDSISPEIEIQIRQSQAAVDEDPNLRLFLAYRFFTTEITESENLYRTLVNQLSNNFFGASTIIQPNNNLGIQVVSNQSGFLSFRFVGNDVLQYSVDVDSVPRTLTVIKNNDSVATIIVPESAQAVGFFAFIRTYDQATLQPLFSLVVGDESGRLVSIPQ